MGYAVYERPIKVKKIGICISRSLLTFIFFCNYDDYIKEEVSNENKQRIFNRAQAIPAEIARIAFDGIEDESYEIVADDPSRKVRSDFTGDIQTLYPQLF
ncbi:hypothetical protein [Paenibacillus sp. 8b26]|uniref:hypothetical protein n=1 Tax=Paenibacillus sp. 8b26 TaxID=3424133 RepID=UPI003D65E5F7